MPPHADALATWLPSLAEVEEGAAPGEHRVLACRPGGRAAVRAEEPVEGGGLLRVMHAHDPLAPGQILHRVPGMGPFPVQDGRDLPVGLVEQDVVRPDEGVVALLGIGEGQARVDWSDPSGTLLARPAGGASLPTVTARRFGGTRYPPNVAWGSRSIGTPSAQTG
jgi:hypothetical protein